MELFYFIPCKQSTLGGSIFHLSWVQKWKPFQKKFARLGAAAVSVSLFLPQKQPFLDFLQGNNYSDSHHLQGVWNLPHKLQLYLILYFLMLVPSPILILWGLIVRPTQEHRKYLFNILFIISKLFNFPRFRHSRVDLTNKNIFYFYKVFLIIIPTSQYNPPEIVEMTFSIIRKLHFRVVYAGTRL